MSESSNNPENARSVVSNRTMEIIVALALMTVAIIVMVDSYILGAGWAPALGPESGYFPFYVSLIMLITSAATLLQQLFTRRIKSGPFIHRHEAVMVLSVLIPMTIFVVLTIYIGIYVSAFLFIAFFMLWLGRYPIYITVPVSVAVPIILFVVFEFWFLVPLPKGPLENWLGY